LAIEILNIVSVVIQIILFIALIFVIISLTRYFKILTGKIESLEEDINRFKTRVDPLIDDSRIMVQKIIKVSDKIDENFVYVTKTIEKLKSAADDIVDFKTKVLNRVETPVFDTISAFSAIVKGVRAFTDTWKGSKPLKQHSYQEKDDLLFDDSSEVEFELEKQYDDINKELNEVRKKLEEMKKV
jgi:peptidoglycan hydrolase CwlO-like protein